MRLYNFATEDDQTGGKRAGATWPSCASIIPDIEEFIAAKTNPLELKHVQHIGCGDR